MKVNRNLLVQALELVSPGLSSKRIINEQSNSFIFKDKKVLAFDDELAASIPSPLDINCAIASDPLKDIMNKMREDSLEVKKTSSEIIFKGKGQEVGIRIDNKIESPVESLEVPKKWKKLPETFSEAIKLVHNCVGRDEAEYILTCVHLHPDYIEAFDTFQAARYKLKLDIEEETLVKEVSVKHLVEMEMKEVSETEQWIHFRNETGLVMSCRRYTEVDKYPKLENIVSVKGKKIRLPKSLSEVSERAEVFSSFSEDENHIEVNLKPGWVMVEGKGLYGWYKGRKKIKYAGGDTSFLVPPQLLCQIVKNHSECQICDDPIKAMRAELGNFVYVTSLSETKKKEVKTKKVKKIKKIKKESSNGKKPVRSAKLHKSKK